MCVCMSTSNVRPFAAGPHNTGLLQGQETRFNVRVSECDGTVRVGSWVTYCVYESPHKDRKARTRV